MCIDPTTMGIISTIGGFIGKSAAADRQNAQYQANAVNANQAATEQYYENNNRIIKEEAKAVQQRIQNQTNLIKNKGAAIASTENSGQSTSMVLHDLERQAARANAVTDTNAKNAKIQALQDSRDIQMQTQGRIDSVPMGEAPDLISTALTGLGVVVGAQDTGKYKDETDRGNGAKAK